MSDKQSASEKLEVTISTYRWGFGIAGVVAVTLGALVLVWPREVTKLAALLVAIYAIVTGIFYVVVAVRSSEMKALLRVARVVAGIAFVTAGIVMLTFLGASATVLTNVLGIVLGAMWIAEGVSALLLAKGRLEQSTASLVYALIAVAIGVVLLLTPIWGAAALRWIGGLALVGLGAAQIYRAARASRQIKVDVAVE